MLNIVIPMAGRGTSFKEAGYAFPKPLIDIKGKTMIELVVSNLKPSVEHKFIFVCLREHYEKYDLHNILKRATNNSFEVVLLNDQSRGAACTVLAAIEHIHNDEPLLIANADQYLTYDINSFLKDSEGKDGLIMTFSATHPKWSYARLGKDGKVLETAEKKIISDNATVGMYYFDKGADFVNAAQQMIHKNIHTDNQFYVCPVYNELILNRKKIYTHKIQSDHMHGLGTPEELSAFLKKVENGKLSI